MARETYAQAETNLTDITRIAHDEFLTSFRSLRTDLATARSNYNGDEDAGSPFGQDLGGIQAGQQASWTAIVAELRRVIRRIARADGVDAPLGQMTDAQIMEEIRDYLGDEGVYSGGTVDKYATSRNWTRGSVTGPTNANLYVSYTDKRGWAIEAGHPQIITMRVISGGASKVQRVEILGEPRGVEPAEVLGNGARLELSLFGKSNQTGLVQNPILGPQETTDAANVTSINGWTLASTIGWDIESGSNLFGDFTTHLYSGDTVAANYDLSQVIPRGIDPRVPYLPFCIVRNRSSFVGTFQVDWGSKSQAWTNANFDGTNWTVLVADRDKDLWPVNWDEADADLKFSITTFTSGVIELAAVGLIPGQRFSAFPSGVAGDGWWWGIRADTPCLNEASAIVTNSVGGSEGDYAEILAIALNEYIQATGTNLLAEPA